MRARKLIAAAAAIPLVVAAMGVAHADVITDTIVDDGTSVALTAGSATAGTAGISVANNDNQTDPDNGCNIDRGDSPLVLDIVTPPGITANPDPVTVTDCNVVFDVSFTAAANAQSGTATATITSVPEGGGTYQNLVSIPIKVTQPVAQNTAPQVAVTGVTNGATYRVGSVPTPGCSVVDAEDTNESTTPEVSGGAYDAIGSHTVSCSYTDAGQETRTATASYTVLRALDTTAPVITYTLTPVDGANGWHQGDVTLDWTVTESESPETLVLTGCQDEFVNSDQPATSYTCSATSEGGTSTSLPVSIKRDGTAPTVSYGSVVSGTAGTNGWYKSDVTVNFVASDDISGVSPSSKTVTTSGNGSAVTAASPTFTDNAGNARLAGAVSSPPFKIDTQAPNAPTVTVTPAPNAAGWNKTDVVVSFTAAGDNGPSGVASCTADVPVTSETTGQTVSGTCTDEAGNVSVSASITIKLDKSAPTNVEFVGGPTAGGKYFPNSVPVEPTCTAEDSTSGVNSCVVSGYVTTVGTHTLTATATDNAGNVTTTTRSYTVRNLTYAGFFAPVDRGIHNTVKGGNTVPLKFRVFDEGVEQISKAVVKGFSAKASTCQGGVLEDAVEEWATTGTTELRYDTTAGHFVQNWKTPTKAGQCYTVSVTLIDDTAITAIFKTK